MPFPQHGLVHRTCVFVERLNWKLRWLLKLISVHHYIGLRRIEQRILRTKKIFFLLLKIVPQLWISHSIMGLHCVLKTIISILNPQANFAKMRNLYQQFELRQSNFLFLITYSIWCNSFEWDAQLIFCFSYWNPQTLYQNQVWNLDFLLIQNWTDHLESTLRKNRYLFFSKKNSEWVIKYRSTVSKEEQM